MNRGWRQFSSRVRLRRQVSQHDLVISARPRLDSVVGETAGKRMDRLSAATREQSARAAASQDAVEWFILLVLRAPAAVRAQQMMDDHSEGYHDRQARLFELIDFNDAYVSTILALSERQRNGFENIVRDEIARFCKLVGSRTFSDTQFEAITKGLNREVAVYLGAIDQGFQVTMTTRTQDALGVDMVITEPGTGKRLNIDCKTPSAYHYRIQDLVQQGRLTKEEQSIAEDIGYVSEVNGQGGEAVMVTLLRIDPNEVGDIRDFSFTDTNLLGARLKKMFKEI